MNYQKLLWSIRAVFYNIYVKFPIPGYIGKPIYINNIKKIVFGKKNRIYPGLRAEIFGNKGCISIGNNVSIGQNLHIISNDQMLKIGDNVVISGNVFITNCDHEYKQKDVYLYDQNLITKHTEIGDNCFIGYGAVIQAGTVLGKQCIVGSNAVVRGKYSDYSVIAGVPAKIIKKIDF